MKLLKKDRKKIFIVILSLVILLMAVGYAAFATNLNIGGIASISTSWNVQITNIRGINDKTVSNNQAYEVTQPTITNNNLTANFHTGLVNPGDKRIYEIEVTNLGSVDAQVTTSVNNNTNNEAIIFTYDGVSETSVLQNDGTYTSAGLTKREPFDLLAGAHNKKYLYVVVEYNSAVTNQPSNLEASFSFSLAAVQKDSGTITGGDENLSISLKYTSSPADGTSYNVNEDVRYAITVKNISNEYMYDLSLTSEKSEHTFSVGDLAPGASYTVTDTFRVSEGDIIDGEAFIDVSLSGLDENNHNIDIFEDFEVPIAEEYQDLSVEIATISGPQNQEYYVLNEPINLGITVTNNGNLTLTNVIVETPLVYGDFIANSLAPGESQTFSINYPWVTEEDILAGSVYVEATAEGESPSESEPIVSVANSLDVEVEPIRNGLLITMVSTSSPANGSYYRDGEYVELSMTVTNTGNLTLSNVILNMPLTSDTFTAEALEPGRTSGVLGTGLTISQAHVAAGHVTFTANATADTKDIDEPTISTSRNLTVNTG